MTTSSISNRCCGKYNIGAGATLRAVGGAALRSEAAGCAPAPAKARRPLRLVETQVRPEWVDYNGHMTDSRYLQVFGDATDALFRRVGVDDAYRRAGGRCTRSRRTSAHLAEAKALEALT